MKARKQCYLKGAGLLIRVDRSNQEYQPDWRRYHGRLFGGGRKIAFGGAREVSSLMGAISAEDVAFHNAPLADGSHLTRQRPCFSMGAGPLMFEDSDPEPEDQNNFPLSRLEGMEQDSYSSQVRILSAHHKAKEAASLGAFARPEKAGS